MFIVLSEALLTVMTTVGQINRATIRRRTVAGEDSVLGAIRHQNWQFRCQIVFVRRRKISGERREGRRD